MMNMVLERRSDGNVHLNTRGRVLQTHTHTHTHTHSLTYVNTYMHVEHTGTHTHTLTHWESLLIASN